MTKQMMDEAAFWGQNQLSFRMAEEIVQKLYGTRMTDDHIREATCQVGGVIFERDQARAVEADKNMPHIPSTA
jgi:hypothetical protein